MKFPTKYIIFVCIIYLCFVKELSITAMSIKIENEIADVKFRSASRVVESQIANHEYVNAANFSQINGVLVSQNADPCNPNPCKNGQPCKVKGNSFECKCNYKLKTDPLCEGPCRENPCLNGGECYYEGKQFNLRCKCLPEYFGLTNKCKVATCINGSNGPVCKNGGTCSDKGNKIKCSCVSPYSGPYCENKREIDFCNAHGGTATCIGKGKKWRCVHHSEKEEKCECEENFQDIEDNCIEIDFCNTHGGNDVCIAKGKNWKCVNDLDKEEKYNCECEEFFQEVQEKCIDMKCDYGLNSNSCQRDDQGRKKCHCFSGYAQKAGKCSETCKSSLECKNKGTCLPEKNGYFCKCKPNYKGDKCEINEVCLSMSETCQAIGAVCHYIEWLKKGFCICPPNRTFKKNTNFCEVNNVTEKTEKLESTSIIVIVLCSVAIFLALSAIVLISVFRRYKKK